MDNRNAAQNNSKFIFNQKLTVEQTPEQSAALVHSEDWYFIKNKLKNKTNIFLTVFDTFSSALLGVGVGKMLDNGWRSEVAWLIVFVGIICMLIAYIIGSKKLNAKCDEAIEQMELIERRNGFGQAVLIENKGKKLAPVLVSKSEFDSYSKKQ